jgi:hypothetical protein
MLLAMPSPANNSNDKGNNGWDYSQPSLFTQPLPCGPPPPHDDFTAVHGVADNFTAAPAITAAAAVTAAAATPTAVASAANVAALLPPPPPLLLPSRTLSPPRMLSPPRTLLPPRMLPLIVWLTSILEFMRQGAIVRPLSSAMPCRLFKNWIGNHGDSPIAAQVLFWDHADKNYSDKCNEDEYFGKMLFFLMTITFKWHVLLVVVVIGMIHVKQSKLNTNTPRIQYHQQGRIEGRKCQLQLFR